MTGNCQVRFLEDGVGSNPTLLFDISPLLANMTLDGIEKLLHEHFLKMKVHLIRYVDDFLVTTPTKKIAAEVCDVILEFLAIRGLELSLEKTLITHIDDGFDFLGWCFRKYKGQLLIKPSEKSIKSISQKLKTTVSNARVHVHRPPAVTLNETPEEFHISTGLCQNPLSAVKFHFSHFLLLSIFNLT